MGIRLSSLYNYCLANDKHRLLEEWDYDKNVDLTPETVSIGSQQKVWWRCEKGHEWRSQVRVRVRGSGCPVCVNRAVKPGENDIATTHPHFAAQWHEKNNGTLTPKDIIAGYHKKVWWRCEKGHEWQASPHSRAQRNSGCPVCAGQAVIPGENDLASHFPELAGQWDQDANGVLKPNQVTPHSNRRVWWRCEKGHTYQAVISDRAKDRSGCPVCGGRKVLVGFNDLESQEPEIATQWHGELNGDLTPRMVSVGSNKKVWWQCPLGHVWETAIYIRTGRSRCGCPVCAGNIKKQQFRDP